MPGNSSNLTAPNYTYDFVVATTQASINSTMLTYPSGFRSATVTKCWIVDEDGGTTIPMEYEKLKQQIGGADPLLSLLVPQSRLAVSSKSFLVDNTSAVIEMTYGAGPRPKLKWTNMSQPSTRWVFQSEVDLRLTSVGPKAKQFYDIVSINRNTFATYLRDQLRPKIPANCLIPHARITLKNAGLTKEYSVSISPSGVDAFAIPPTGTTVLSLHYEIMVSDYAGLNNNEGEIHLKPSFNIKVSFQDDNIVIMKHLWVWLHVRSLLTTVKGNIVDEILKDTYKLGVDEYGNVFVSEQSTVVIQ
ncbi:MAG: hypothetical protein Q9183_003117 [Haloplaca sp. 2 TL-2023]